MLNLHINRDMKYYFTGKPCKRGHIAKRLKSNNTCIECQRIAVKKFNCRGISPARRKYNREYQRRKRHEDLNFKLAGNLRVRMWLIAKKNRGGSCIKDLGCSIEEFKAYIESKFQDGMTWQNWSLIDGWHLDHIRPLASFNLSDPEQFKKAAHYSNIQPLWASENVRKGSKW